MQKPSQQLPASFSVARGMAEGKKTRRDELDSPSETQSAAEYPKNRVGATATIQRKRKLKFAIQQLEKHRGGATSTQLEHKRQVALWHKAMRYMGLTPGPSSVEPGEEGDERLRAYAAYALTELELRDLDKVRGMLNKEVAAQFPHRYPASPWITPATKDTLKCYSLVRQEFIDLNVAARQSGGSVEGVDFSYLEGVGETATAAQHRCLVPPSTLEWMLTRTQEALDAGDKEASKRLGAIWLQFIICQRGCTVGGSNNYMASQGGLGKDISFDDDGMRFKARFLKHWNPGIRATVAAGSPAAVVRKLPIDGPLIPWGEPGSARHCILSCIKRAKDEDAFVDLDQGGQASGADLVTEYMEQEGIPAHASQALQELEARSALPASLRDHFRRATFTSHSLRYSAVTLAIMDGNAKCVVAAYVGWVRLSNVATYFVRDCPDAGALKGVFDFLPNIEAEAKAPKPKGPTPKAKPKPKPKPKVAAAVRKQRTAAIVRPQAPITRRSARKRD